MKKRGQLDKDTVVATQMSNVGLELCLKKAGLKLLLTEVGDKYVVDAMKQGGFKLGGEQSGHIIFLENGTTGDGLIAALRVLEVMVEGKKKLSQLRNLMTVVPQVLRNVRITKRKNLEEVTGLEVLLKKVEKKLWDRARCSNSC
jgi:phosphoglucosamine mutase